MSPVRVYGALIALASGAYAVWRAVGMMTAMTAPASIMGLVGVVAMLHGLLLLTPVAATGGFARASGPLMLTYAVIMLGVQTWLALAPPVTMMMGRAWDAGMVALALLMAASGVVMTWLSRARETGRAAAA